MRNNSCRLLGILAIVFALLLFNGCKKVQDKGVQVPEDINKHPLESLFFATADSVPATVKKVSAYLQKRSDKSEIVTSVIDAIGLPAWDKAVIIEAKASKTAIGSRTAPLDTSYLFVPIVPQGTEEVDGAFVCKIVGDSVSVLLLNEKNYKEYGFDASKPRNAHHLVSLMMFLQAKAFGTECFVLNDGRLFENNSAAVDSSGKRFIYIGNNAASSNRQNKTLFAADYIIETTICYYPNNTNRAIAASVYVPPICYKLYEWIPTGGSSSGSYNPGMGPGGGSGGSTSTASFSITEYFQQTLGLTSAQLIILNPFPQLSEECFNYLQINDGQLTYEDQKKLVASHMLNLKPNPLYLEYCESVSVQNAQSQGKYYPWFRYNTLFNANSALANNIQKLKLDAKQAYYLLNNPIDQNTIVQFLNNNQNSLEANSLAVSAIDNAMLYGAVSLPEIIASDDAILFDGGGSNGAKSISKLDDYIKCFTNNDNKPVSGYKFAVFAEQPSPGARTIYTGTQVTPNPGHSFIMVERSYTDGTKNNIVIGFYPNSTIRALSQSTLGKLMDNEEHDYNVKVEMAIDKARFDQILSYIKSKENATYNLDTYNCTNFAIEASQFAGINFNRTVGCWFGNHCGLSPANLGQDMIETKFTTSTPATRITFSLMTKAGVGDGPCN